MRVLVTGAAGQLGGDLLEALRIAGHQGMGVDRRTAELVQPGVAVGLLGAGEFDAVVNCAAYNAVDRAESEPEEAMRVNAAAPALLAEAAAAARVLLVHLSTDFVFDGAAGRPYTEADVARPVNVYGRSKLAGEQAVLQRSDSALVVRTAWLFGRSGPNFVLSILRQAWAGARLRVVDDQRGSPTWTGHLAPAIVRLLDHARQGRVSGIVHLVNSGEASRWEFARTALDAAGLTDVAVEPMASDQMSAAAPRPARSTLDSDVWPALGERPLPRWDEAVRGYVTTVLHAGETAPGRGHGGHRGE